MAKGEPAQLLILRQCFHKSSSAEVSESVFIWKIVKCENNTRSDYDVYVTAVPAAVTTATTKHRI